MVSKVLLKPRRAKPFWCGEPWVFDGSVDRVKGRAGLRDGEVVDLCDDVGNLVGRGFWSDKSPIRVRMVARGEQLVDADLIGARIERAVALRHEVLGLRRRATAYRLIHAEGDGLPGLVVDRLGDQLVVQFDCAGIRRFRDVVLDRLESLLEPVGIHERSSRAAREQEGLEPEEGLRRGAAPEAETEVEEEGLRYLVDVRAGQKTGFYADQRDNRLAVAALARGRRVLDAFCYVGSFGLSALVRGEAAEAVGVDSSGPALELARRNAEVNGVADRFEPTQANVLRYLDHLRKEAPRSFGLVVLDPPKLVPKRSALRKGLKLYREINAKGMTAVEEGGILCTCSCSQAVSDADLRDVVAEASLEARREVQLLYVGSQGADHPAWVPHEVSRYLKCRIYRVF